MGYIHNFNINRNLYLLPSVCLPFEDCTEILYVEQAGLDFPGIHLLGLKACATTTGLHLLPFRKAYAYYII